MVSHRWSVYPSICSGHLCIHLSCIHPFVGSNNFSKCQCIFIRLGLCIDIVEIWFEIANGQILSIFSSPEPKAEGEPL